jgi:hypothetical protein
VLGVANAGVRRVLAKTAAFQHNRKSLLLSQEAFLGGGRPGFGTRRP